MKKFVLIDGSTVSALEAKRVASDNVADLEGTLASIYYGFEKYEDYEIECFNAELEYWESILEDANAEIKNARYIIGYDCLLEGVFVPNMEDRMQKKSMQQRFREMEPDVFDSDVSQEQLNDWIYC